MGPGLMLRPWSRLVPERPRWPSPKEGSSRRAPLFALLVVGYLVLVLAVFWRLTGSAAKQAPSIDPVVHVVAADTSDGEAVVLAGQGLRRDTKVLLSDALLNEDDYLWRLLPGVSIHDIVANEQLAVVACLLNKLICVRLGGPNGPELAGAIELPGKIRALRFYGSRVIALLKEPDRLALIDVADPDSPKRIEDYALPGSSASLVLSGDTVYFSDMKSGLGRLDLSARAPSAEMLLPIEGAWQLAVRGRRLVMTTADGRVLLFELQQDGRPQAVGKVEVGVDGLRGGVRGVVMTDDLLLVAVADGALRSYRLSTWPNLEPAGLVNLPGHPSRVVSVPGEARFLVSLVAGGVVVIDTNSRGVPSIEGHLAWPSIFQSMAVSRGQLLASGQARFVGLYGFDIDAIAVPPKTSRRKISDESMELLSWNGALFGLRRDKVLYEFALRGSASYRNAGAYLPVHDRDGVSVFKGSAQGVPLRIGTLIAEDGAVEAIVRDSLLFVLHGAGLRVMTGETLGTMQTTAELKLSGRPVCMRPLGKDYLLVLTRDDGLKVVAVDNPGRPRLVASAAPPGHLMTTAAGRGLELDGEMAFVSQGKGGVYSVDLSDPAAPEVLQIIDTPGLARQLVLERDLLLVADFDEGIFMIDASDRRRLLPIGSLPTNLRANDIAVSGDRIVISSYPGGTTEVAWPRKVAGVELTADGNLRLDPGAVAGRGGADSDSSGASSAASYLFVYDEQGYSRTLLDRQALTKIQKR
jgi:hypothetical protein